MDVMTMEDVIKDNQENLNELSNKLDNNMQLSANTGKLNYIIATDNQSRQKEIKDGLYYKPTMKQNEFLLRTQFMDQYLSNISWQTHLRDISKIFICLTDIR